MIDSSKLNEVASELTLAGTDPRIRERIERLEQRRRITPERELPPMRFLFRLFGRPCFPRGELVAITGKAKSGKTFVTSMLMALCTRQEVLSFVRHTDDAEKAPPLRLLWLDTEQSEESTQDILKHRIIPMAQLSPPWEGLGEVFNLRGEPWQERLPLVEAAIVHYRPDLVILDGIRDLVNDINDGVLAQQVIEQLMALASAGACCIVCVLHQNKANEDRNLRGWIGTELMNKAFEVYACEKQMPSRLFSVEQTLTRKYDIPDVMYYTVGEDGLPVPADGQMTAVAPTGGPVSRYPSLNDAYVVHEEDGGWHIDVERLFRDALGGREQAGHFELQRRVMELSNVCSYQLCAELFRQAVEQRVIVKTQDAQRHVVYRATPF